MLTNDYKVQYIYTGRLVIYLSIIMLCTRVMWNLNILYEYIIFIWIHYIHIISYYIHIFKNRACQI